MVFDKVSKFCSGYDSAFSETRKRFESVLMLLSPNEPAMVTGDTIVYIIM